MKKICSVFLSAALLLSGLTFPAAAAGEDYAGKTVVLYTGNIRGNVDLYPQIAQAKKDYEAKGADVILVDTGNYLQGSALANATRGEAVYALMEAVGYDVAGMGLAEFGYTDATTGYPYHGNVTRYYTQALLQNGTEELTYNKNRDGSQTGTLAAKEPAKFKTVCTNVLPQEVYAFESFVDVDIQGGPTVRFLGLADLAVAEQVQDGYVTMGQASMPLDNYADVILTLSNDPAAPADEYTITVSPDAGFTVGALVIDNKTQKLTREEVALGEADPDVTALVWKSRAQEILFTSPVVLNGADSANWNGETNLGDLTADALKWYAETYIDGINADYPVVAIQNGGNCDNFLYTGDITEVDLLNALPFSPMGIGVMEVTGAQLLETIEAATQVENCPGFAQVSGLSYTLNLTEDYDGGAAYGSFFVADSVNRVTITDVAGQSFDSEAIYNLVCDNYLMNGNDTYYTLKKVKDAGARYINNGGGVKVRDAVGMYVKQTMDGVLGETYAAPQGRITIQRFTDVPAAHWGIDAVEWAVTKGITQGTGEAIFTPDRTCTDAEILTFLWRAKGSPEPAGNIGDTYYYTKATAWAADEKITENQGDPDLPCTRAAAVTYLWRAAGSPVAEGENPFEDVAAGSDCEQAVLWAVEKGVTTGTSESAFSPDKVCTRAEIVTFLHRALGE